MKNKSGLIGIIRRTQTTISILLFFIITLFCWGLSKKDIGDIYLSYFGATNVPYSWLWNLVVIILSISIFFNTIFYIKNHQRLKYKWIPYVMFTLVSISLFMVGVFNLEQTLIHNLCATFYFFIYPFSIFVMAYLNRNILLYKEWVIHFIFSVFMIILPLIFIGFFNTLGFSELIHTFVVCGWNIRIAFKRLNVNIYK